ncbi:TRAP transporter small permease [Lentibacillus salinarum]|uniref:TRAP transporter small permease n=1 Tax=Lentibacillus salinarum TaxID=446820 RepID=A0ABW3ZR44_9BACI
MKIFIQVSEILNKICKNIITYLLLIVSVVLFLQVVARFIFDTGTFWTEETARFATIWLVLLGASVVLKDRTLMSVNIVDNFIPNAKKVLYYFKLVTILLYSIFLLYVGWGTLDLVSAQRSPNMGISMSFVYAAVPVMSILMFIHLIVQFFRRKGQEDN